MLKQSFFDRIIKPLLLVLIIFSCLLIRLIYIHSEYNNKQHVVVSQNINQAASVLKMNPDVLKKMLIKFMHNPKKVPSQI